MAFKDYLIPTDNEDVTCCHNDARYIEKPAVVGGKHNLASTSKLKSYSMPDLLEVDCVKQAGHKHPNLQFSTRLTSSSVDINNYLPKKSPNLKSKLANGLKCFKKKPRVNHADVGNNFQRDKLDGLGSQNHKSHTKVVQPFTGLSVLNQQYIQRTPCIQRLKANDGARWRSEDNLNCTKEDVRLLATDNEYGFNQHQIHAMKRALSHEPTTFVSINEFTDYY